MVSRLFESFMFVKAFKLRTFYCFTFDHVFDCFDSSKCWPEWLAVVKLHRLLATRTIHEAKHYTR